MKLRLRNTEIEIKESDEKGTYDVIGIQYLPPVKPIVPTMRTEMVKKLVTKVKEHDYAKDVQILHLAGLSDKTIVMIASKVLDMKSNSEHLVEDFQGIETKALEFLTRPIKDKIWAVYAAAIDIPYAGYRVALIGLNEKNQLVILSVNKDSPVQAYADVVSRGLNASEVKLGILSFHLDSIPQFKEAFPNAKVQLDWQEYIDLSVGNSTKILLKRAMLERDPNSVSPVLKSLNAPGSLMTHFDFPKPLSRALKTTAPVKRLEKDIRSKVRKKGVKTTENRELVLAWALIRLQYHWYKVPVDSNQLSNLRYIQAQYEELR